MPPRANGASCRFAPTIVPPEQVNVDASMSPSLGGIPRQWLAQSFTVLRSGELSHLTLPLSCQSKALVMGFRITELYKPVHLDPGEYAFTLRTKGGDCGDLRWPAG